MIVTEDILTIQGDTLEIIKSMPSNSVDLIFTDPPYWTLNKWRNVGTTTRLGGNRDKEKQEGWFDTIDENELFKFMCECFRILKQNNHACIMCDGQTLKWVLGYAEESGFNYYKPLVWDKVSQGMGYHFRNKHEFIVLLDKGKNKQPKDLGLPDIITIPMIKGGYPTEKPVELSKFFINQYTNIGDTIFDGFMGSGSTLVAAKQMKRKAIGIDISSEAYKITNERLSILEPIENNKLL